MNSNSILKKSVFTIVSFAAILLAANLLYGFLTPDLPYRKYFPGNDYKAYWQKVDSLESDGLTESANKVVLTIYDMARKDKNTPQIVKSLIYKMKYRNTLEEEAFKKNFDELNAEINTAEAPLKQVLYSLKGQMLWTFYQQNRWRFSQRTAVQNFEQENVLTWDLSKLTEETINAYNASLTDAPMLKKVPLMEMEAILDGDNSYRERRPMLYDFLAYRALDFFTADEADMYKPAVTFRLDNPVYFSDRAKFMAAGITSADSLATKFHALQVLRGLLEFHASDSKPEALIEADLARLRFVHTYAVLDGKDSLYLDALRSLEKKYRQDPASAEAGFELAAQYSRLGNTWKPFEGNESYRNYLVKAAEICREIMDRHPSSYGGLHCAQLLKDLNRSSLSSRMEHANLPGKPFVASAEYRNLSKIYARIVKLDYDEYEKRKRDFKENEALQYLAGRKVLKEWTTDVDNGKDHQAHRTEMSIPAHEAGYYILLLSENPAFDPAAGTVTAQEFWITRLVSINRTNEKYSENQVYVTDRETGEPLAGVTVHCHMQKYNAVTRKYERIRFKSLKTDNSGMGMIRELGSSYRNFSLELVSGKDRYVPASELYQYNSYPDPEPQPVTHFFLDRGIYRPGQTVHFKGLMVKPEGEDHKILTGTAATVELMDANQQLIASVKVKSNDYGTFAGSFTLPAGGLTGQWFIRDQHGYSYFSVEEYKRPKFEVHFDTLKESYRVNEKVTVTGIAKAYAGFAIDGAKVSYRVYRNTNYPIWSYYWRWRPQTPSQEILSGTAVTNENGAFAVTFNAQPDEAADKKLDPYFTYTIEASVTDLNGETRSSVFSMEVGYTAVKLEAGIPDQLDINDTNRYYISVVNRAGYPVPASGQITVTELIEPARLLRNRIFERPDMPVMNEVEFTAAFPHDIYADERELVNFKRGNLVFAFPFDVKKPQAIPSELIRKMKPGRYIVEGKTRDSFGQDVRTVKYVTVYDPADKKMPVKEYQWNVPVDIYCEPGETAKILIGSADKNVKVLYEIEHKNKITYREIITLNNEQKLVQIPVKEEHRGNFTVHFTFIKDNRAYYISHTVSVPFSNKVLDLKFVTFRNKLLPGAHEEWKIAVSGPGKEKVAAELLASMYDASLDAFRPTSWYLALDQYHYQTRYWNTSDVNASARGYAFLEREETDDVPYKSFEALDLFGFYLIDGSDFSGYFGGAPVTMNQMMRKGDEVQSESRNSDRDEKAPMEKSLEEVVTGNTVLQTTTTATDGNNGKDVKPRTNFEETAFFFPQLETNENGDFVFSFKIPESLTSWKFQGLAHTKDLKSGRIEETVVTQKELMVNPFAPRFLRENDEIVFTAKITNLSDHDIENGKAKLRLFDAITMKPADGPMGNTGDLSFSVKKGQSTQVSWAIRVPSGLDAVTYRVTAEGGEHSDGEEMTIPVLLNSMLVTETMPLPVNGGQTKTFRFDKLTGSGSSTTMRNHKLTLEFTSNPSWYAVQALPYMMEYPYECAEQTFNRLYANSIATHIANSNPAIRKVFDVWKNHQPDALLSNLEKNQELKALVLEETPWLLDAKDESERKRRIALLFDFNRMSSELGSAMRKLERMQLSNGGWPWFEGSPDNRYITQYIISGFGHLKNLGINSDDATVRKMAGSGLVYLDDRIREDYENLLKFKVDLSKHNISGFQIQYLYARSFFKEIEVSERNRKAFDYFLGQSKKFWTNEGVYMKGMIALANTRFGDKVLGEKIVRSLKESAVVSEEMGMYWKVPVSWYWHEAPVETQALLIEAFDEITEDLESVEKMKVWLLKNKQTNDWKTTKATSEACYALLLRGTSQLTDDARVVIRLGNITVDPANDPLISTEAGTGYFKTSWSGSDIRPDMGNVTVSKDSKGVAWGALYWQYFEQLDKITPASTPVKITKKLFRQVASARGPQMEPVTAKTRLSVGDRIRVRIEISVDRPMEFVHLKDMRASAFEPENVFSGYRFQDGLGYYESTRDAATNFFIDYLPKGTFVFEYPVRITHEGNFSNGITSLQCMYAPEFTSHSEGIRVTVGK